MPFNIPSSTLLRFFILLISVIFNHSAVADMDELYHLSIGTNLERYDSEFSIDASNSSNGTSIDFEDDLGYDSRARTLWISAWYRVGDLHRLRMTYTPLNRSAQASTTKDITINDTIVKAGANFSASTETDVLDFSYIYSFYKSPQLEMGMSAGLYWLSNKTTFSAAGEIQAPGEDQPSFKSDYFSEQKIQAPMPLFGVSAIYEITPDWRTHTALRYLSVQLNDIDGRIASAELGAEYYFSDNWGAGMSLNFFDLKVDVDNLLTNSSLGWGHNGIQIYATFKY